MSEVKSEFEDWLLHGSGEESFGNIVKAAATREHKRLTKKLGAPSLFPHIEHEDRVALDKAAHLKARGQRMVDRGRKRNTTVSALLSNNPAKA